MKKKLFFLTLVFTLLFCGAITVFADNKPVLSLEANQYNSNGERHIKVTWEGPKGSYELQIADNDDFKNAIIKKRSVNQGAFYNFVLDENVDATYYIRVRQLNKEWSNVVVADINKPIETEGKPYFTIPNAVKIPNIKTIKVPLLNLRNHPFPID